MAEGKADEWERRALDLIERRWKVIVFLVWVGFCAWFIYRDWDAIRFFALGDTDDNMRMMQVRALLRGQGWFDLRQYRMNPPFGANIHWSRLVDLPIAGLILGLRPLIGGAAAERWAAGISPLLPYCLLLFATALTARRLLDPRGYGRALLALFFAGSTNAMFMPERIDHHGWQLALLATSIAGMADSKRMRGGLTLGITTALSMAIGLEMMIYLALAGVATVLYWVDDRAEQERLRAYALSLTAGVALAFLVFVSYDNRNPVCDALSPVWLSDALLGGALLYGLAWISPATWPRRLALGFLAGAVLAAFHGLMWPHCLQRLEGVSPEVNRLWLSHVQEARPIYRHTWQTAVLIAALPITGAVGWLMLIWRTRHNRELLRRVLAVAAVAIVAGLLLLWQTRTGPAAQMLAVTGAAALAAILVGKVKRSRFAVARVLGTVVITLIGAGALVPLVIDYVPSGVTKNDARSAAIGRANRLCNTLWGYHPVALQPKGMVFTFIDFGPRLITVTHHDAVGGPYHRNGQQIADVMNAWRGSADQAHQIIVDKYHSDYVLSCPNSSTTTIFMSEAPHGFYGQLEHGQIPKWLRPVDLPKDSPFRMWRVVG